MLFLAATVRRPLIATGFAASRAWQANSWDRMVFPKPFAKVVVAYGPPAEVARASVKDDTLLAAEIERLRAAMESSQQEADAELARWLGKA